MKRTQDVVREFRKVASEGHDAIRHSIIPTLKARNNLSSGCTLCIDRDADWTGVTRAVEVLATQGISILSQQSIGPWIWSEVSVVCKFRIPHLDCINCF